MFKLSMPPLPIETNNVLFDISRLYRSRNRDFATGVDRIDLAIGLNLLRQFKSRCFFLYTGPFGTVILPHRLGRTLIIYLEASWNRGKSRKPPRRLMEEPLLRTFLPSGLAEIVHSDTTYVVASHSGLAKVRGAMRRLDPDRAMRRLVYLHDIIPLEMPEYQRPETREIFESYLRELTDAPLTIASNSRDTDSRVRRLATREGWPVQSFLVSIPKLERLPKPGRPPRPAVAAYIADPDPFFAVVGTIEPRKNHLLLLNLWRQMALSDEDVPRLCIIGKRGWENENILDMLDRCPAIQGSVREFSNLDDYEVQLLLQASKALLFPSFIEGLGVPLLEAAALDVPCIVSDIPVFRESAPAGTVFLDPLDGPGWKRAILSKLKRP